MTGDGSRLFSSLRDKNKTRPTPQKAVVEKALLIPASIPLSPRRLPFLKN
jgi:hypothetical protein